MRTYIDCAAVVAAIMLAEALLEVALKSDFDPNNVTSAVAFVALWIAIDADNRSKDA